MQYKKQFTKVTISVFHSTAENSFLLITIIDSFSQRFLKFLYYNIIYVIIIIMKQATIYTTYTELDSPVLMAIRIRLID